MDASAGWLSLNLILTLMNLSPTKLELVTASVRGVMLNPVIVGPLVADAEGLGAGGGVVLVGFGAGVLLLGVGAGVGVLNGAATGVSLADRETAVRHAWIDAPSRSIIQGNPVALNSVPNRAPLLCR